MVIFRTVVTAIRLPKLKHLGKKSHSTQPSLNTRLSYSLDFTLGLTVVHLSQRHALDDCVTHPQFWKLESKIRISAVSCFLLKEYCPASSAWGCLASMFVVFGLANSLVPTLPLLSTWVSPPCDSILLWKTPAMLSLVPHSNLTLLLIITAETLSPKKLVLQDSNGHESGKGSVSIRACVRSEGEKWSKNQVTPQQYRFNGEELGSLVKKPESLLLLTGKDDHSKTNKRTKGGNGRRLKSFL